MGMPISLALRGRHADDDAGARRLGRRHGARCARSTGCSAPTGPTPSSPGWAAARSALGDCPPEVAEVLALGAAAERELRRRVQRPPARPGRRGRPRPERRGQGLGGRARRRRAAGPRRHRLLPVRRRRPGLPDPRPRRARRGGSASRTRATPAGSSPSCRSRTGAVATSGTAHRGQHLVDARTGRPPSGVASVTVVAGSLTWRRHRRHRRLRARARDAARWLATRPGRTGLVVWADGTTTTVRGAARRLLPA